MTKTQDDFPEFCRNLKEFVNNFIGEIGDVDDVCAGKTTEHNDMVCEESSSNLPNLIAPSSNDNYFYGKDNLTKWSKFSTYDSSMDINFINPYPSLTDYSLKAKTPLQFWELFITFVDKIVECTNDNICHLVQKTICNCCKESPVKMRPLCKCKLICMKPCFLCKKDICVKHKNICNDCIKMVMRDYSEVTSDIEIKAFFGILYTLGAVNTAEHWKPYDYLKIIFNSMKIHRFIYLLLVIRFDDVSTSKARGLTDHLAPIRNIYDTFCANITKSYSPGFNCTIDEVYLKMNGDCIFKRPIPNGQQVSGIKLYFVVDSSTHFITNLEIDCGKQPDGPFETDYDLESVFQRIANPILDFGRNITTSDLFTTLKLSKNLFNRYTSIVGAINPDLGEIPHIFGATQNRAIKSNFFGFDKRTSLVSHITESNQLCLLLSTMHHDDKILGNQTPQIVQYFIDTKDEAKKTVADCEKYSISRGCRKWPLQVFFTFLDIAANNAQKLALLANHKQQTPLYDNRERFLKDLSLSLLQPYLYVHSFHDPNIPKELFTNFNSFSIKNLNELVYEMCEYQNDQQTRKCQSCTNEICIENSVSVCFNCADKRKYNNDID